MGSILSGQQESKLECKVQTIRSEIRLLLLPQLTEKQVLNELAELNETYFNKFGYVFLICATGKTAAEMLAILKVTPCVVA